MFWLGRGGPQKGGSAFDVDACFGSVRMGFLQPSPQVSAAPRRSVEGEILLDSPVRAITCSVSVLLLGRNLCPFEVKDDFKHVQKAI